MAESIERGKDMPIAEGKNKINVIRTFGEQSLYEIYAEYIAQQIRKTLSMHTVEELGFGFIVTAIQFFPFHICKK